MSHTTLAAPLSAPSMDTDIGFEAPTEPGEYKICVHIRSSSAVGVDVKRKVSFSVLKMKPVNATTGSAGSGTSTETAESSDLSVLSLSVSNAPSDEAVDDDPPDAKLAELEEIDEEGELTDAVEEEEQPDVSH